MMTVTFNNNHISAYTFEEGYTLTSTGDNISCEHFIIGDMNSYNATIHTGVTIPDDWQGGKYLFDGLNWSANKSWTDLKEAEITELEDRLATTTELETKVALEAELAILRVASGYRIVTSEEQ